MPVRERLPNTSIEIHEAYKRGDFGLRVWTHGMETAMEQDDADLHLAIWIVYLDTRDRKRANWFRERARKQDGGLTLPDTTPELYDLQYIPPQRGPWRYHPSEVWWGEPTPPATKEQRAATLKSALRGFGSWGEMIRGKEDAPPPNPVTQQQALDALRQKGSTEPVKMSPELAAKLGLNKKEEEK